jgi:tetratricopeptide (TPR) repeat protein
MTTPFPSGESVLQELNLEKEQIKSQFTGTKLHQYIAVYNWIIIHSPKPDADNLAKIQGYLQAFSHLIDVQDWTRARKLLCTQLNSPNSEELHQLLNTWGYYQEQVNVLNQLVDKIPKDNALILLQLGEAYNFLGKYEKSHTYFEKARTEIELNPNIIDRATVLDALGGNYLLQGDYEQAFICLTQALKLIEITSEQARKQNILENLGKV